MFTILFSGALLKLVTSWFIRFSSLRLISEILQTQFLEANSAVVVRKKLNART